MYMVKIRNARIAVTLSRKCIPRNFLKSKHGTGGRRCRAWNLEMDNLAKDAAAALAAGMSYGQYMAMKEAGKVPAVQDAKRGNPDQITGQQKRLFCIHCGKPIPDNTRQRLYCGEVCRKLVTSERAQEKYRRKVGAPASTARICPICGAEFFSTDRRKIMCSPVCSKAARSERVKRYQEQKRAKENANHGI